MKVVITNLKAPWPAGAAMGSVVEVGEHLPGCLVGKCKPAEDGAEAAHRYEPVLPTSVLAETAVAASVSQADPDELAIAQNLLAEARAEVEELQSMLAKAQEQLQATAAERDAAKADIAKAQEQLQAAAAAAKAGKAK